MDLSKLATVTLPDSNGDQHKLADLWAEQPMVVAFLRHFG